MECQKNSVCPKCGKKIIIAGDVATSFSDVAGKHKTVQAAVWVRIKYCPEHGALEAWIDGMLEGD